MNEREEELTKKQSKIVQLTADLNKQKAVTKEKEKEMGKITSDIAKYVESKNEKEYIAGLMKLNSTYVKTNQGDNRARRSEDPHTLEEMDR